MAMRGPLLMAKGLFAAALWTLAALACLPGQAQAQPVCPPGEHFVPGYGCVPNRPPHPVPPPHAPGPGPRAWAVPPAQVPPAGLPAVIVAGPARLRNCAAPRCAVVGTLPPGERVVYLSHERGFGFVQAPRLGMSGWVRLRHLASVY